MDSGIYVAPRKEPKKFLPWTCLKCCQRITTAEDAKVHRLINMLGPNKCVDAMGPRKKWGCKTGTRPIVKHPSVKLANRRGWNEEVVYHEHPITDDPTAAPKRSVLWRVQRAPGG